MFDIRKPQTDDREYIGIHCSNGARLLLISDSKTDKSAVALNAGVGAMHEDRKYNGVAHLVEHMIFMGSEKYPDIHEFSKFMENHGGSTNAFTDEKSTVYIFDIAPSHFKNAFDVFVHAFIKPLFTDTAISSEINAVNQEHEKNMAADNWRYRQIILDTMDLTHPIARFFTGNTYTLKMLPEKDNISSQQLVRDFYNSMYSSNLINLVVLSKEPLQELIDLIVPLVNNIENKNVKLDLCPSRLFDKFGQLVRIVPIKEAYYLGIVFTIPDTIKNYRSVPFRVLSKFIEGSQDGGLLNCLETLGWAESFSFSELLAIPGCSAAEAGFTLSSIGMEHWEEIVHLFFAHIEHYRHELELWRFKEYQKIFEIGFNYSEKVSPWSYVTDIADQLPLFEIEDALTGGDLMEEIRMDLVSSIIDHIVPEQCNVYLSSKEFDSIAIETEQWYGTKYVKSTIADEVIQKWKNVEEKRKLFFKPPKNEFVPTQFDLLPVNIDQELSLPKDPTIIAEDSYVRVWHKQDTTYKRPRAYMMISIISVDRYNDKEIAVAYDFFTQLLSLSLRRELSQARRCGYTFSMRSLVDSLQIVFGGFDDKLELLTRTVFHRIFNLNSSANEFALIKESTIREYKNVRKQKQPQMAMMEFSYLLGRKKFTPEQLLPYAEGISYERFADLKSKVIKHSFFDILVFGNINSERSMTMVPIIMKSIEPIVVPLKPDQKDTLKETYLTGGSSYLRIVENEAHPSNAVLCRYQITPYTMPTYVYGMLYVEIFDEHFFDVLRTREHLGYHTSLDFSSLKHSYYIGVFVQSERDTLYVQSRIDNLINSTEELLRNMSDEIFEEHLESLKSRISEKPKNMREQGLRWFKEFTKAELMFDRRDRILKVLESTTKQNIIDFYMEYLSLKSKNMRRLMIFVKPSESVLTMDVYNKFKDDKEAPLIPPTTGIDISTTEVTTTITDADLWITSMKKINGQQLDKLV